jgi:hypothetical protein
MRFSTAQVHKAALANELVKLGIPASLAHKAVNDLGKQWDERRPTAGLRLYVLPDDHECTVLLCSEEWAGGQLHEIARSTVEFVSPKIKFAMIPISDLFELVTNRLQIYSKNSGMDNPTARMR